MGAEETPGKHLFVTAEATKERLTASLDKAVEFKGPVVTPPSFRVPGRAGE
jgi:hypothetical protein